MIAYKDVVDRYPDDNVVSQARFALGRLNEAAGKFIQARDYYLQIERTESPASTVGTQVSLRLKEMFSKHPELIPTISTPTNVTNAPAFQLERP